MDLSIEHRFDQLSSNARKWIIPILLLLILVVAGIRAYPWLNTKLQALLPVQNEQNISASTAQSTNRIELDTELSPIITDRDISLNEARSQQLTQFLSGLNDAPEVEVVVNSEDKILLAEAISPKEPELEQGTNTASNIIGQASTGTIEKPLITEVPQSTQLSSTSLKQDSAQNIVEPATDVNTTSQSNKTNNITQTQATDQEVIATEANQASSTIKTASLLPIANTIPLDQADQTADSTLIAPATKTLEPAVASTIKTTNAGEAGSSSELDIAKQLINTQITNWASAWSSQSVEQYFQFYTPDMSAPRHKTHEEWRAWRRNRLSQPSSISLEINKVEIDLDSSDPSRATASFVQSYQADTFSDKVIKLLVLVNLDGRWLIKQEKSLETL